MKESYVDDVYTKYNIFKNLEGEGGGKNQRTSPPIAIPGITSINSSIRKGGSLSLTERIVKNNRTLPNPV
jgi:hypothetical protein